MRSDYSCRFLMSFRILTENYLGDYQLPGHVLYYMLEEEQHGDFGTYK